MTSNSEVQRIERLGLKVERQDAQPRQVGPVVSRFIGSVTLNGKQVGFFRATRELEFVGWGWVERATGQGRTEYDDFLRFLTALDRLVHSKQVA